ncbi:hypothetical protein PIB30_084015, partial [Stylosanthes scabra]|nr:hypothetical protein [Stylosanthes scabra]
SDDKTVGRGRMVSKSWNERLLSNDFVSQHFKHPKNIATLAFAHFGMKGPRAIRSWVMRLNTETRSREPLKMSFLRNNQGKVDIIGSENGNIVVRYTYEDLMIL